ncbi:retrovirus-related pol polyprotein from transposon TNT 1-94 [Tanacetum coccineum]
MHDEFEMSMMGELNFFLGLQIKQMEDGIFFNQSKYIKEMLKKFGLEDSKPMKTPMSSDTKLTKDEECESVDSTKYQGMIGFAYIDKLNSESYVLYDHVMTPLTAQLEQKPKKDRGMRRGRHSTSSSSAFDPNHPHLILNDDDEYGNDEGTSVQALLPH